MREKRYAVEPPAFDAPIDFDGTLALLPEAASVRGMYLQLALDYAERHAAGADVFARADLEPRSFKAFLNYPYENLLRLNRAAAELAHPELPLGEGLRRIGHEAFDTLVSAQVGRVIFAVLGRDFSRVVAVGAKGWKVSMSFGTVRHEALGENHSALHFSDMPAFLGTYQVGVVEGAMRWCGVQNGEVQVKVKSLSSATMEMWWD